MLNIKGLALVVTCVVMPMANGDTYPKATPEPGWLSPDQLSMLPLERETTANHLSAYVANHLSKSDRVDRATWVPRLLGLALALHPENPRTQQTNEALASGSELPALETELDAEVLARLLYHRAEGLQKNEGADKTLAPYLIAAAAYIGPYIEEAVFKHENRHLREGALNWIPICGQTRPQKSTR